MGLRVLSFGWVVMVVVAAIGCGDDDSSVGDAGVQSVASKLIGPAGGSVELAGGGKVEIPQDALTETVEIKITKLDLEDVADLPDNLLPAGKPFAFEPHGTLFALPVKVEIPFEPEDDDNATDVRPIKAEDEDDADWRTIVGSDKDNADKTLSFDVSSFSVIIAARPNRNSGFITLPDGATVPIDSGRDAATQDAQLADANTLDANALDATAMIDAGGDASVGAAIQCDAYTPVDGNLFATAPVVAFTRGNGSYGVMWNVSNGAKAAIWDGTQWHPQIFVGADFYPVVTAIDGAGNTYADWGTGRATLPAGANAFGAIDTTRTPAPYGAGHNIGLIGLPTTGAMAVWSEVSMKSAQATPSLWQMGTTVDARRLNGPDIAVNADGDIAATWWDTGASAGQADVTLARWGGSTWTLVPDHTVGAAIGGSAASVRVLMLSNGDPYVFYAQATNGDQSIHAVRYNVTGGTWGSDERLIDNANNNYKVVIDSSDRITVVATDPTTSQVRAARRIGGVWSAAVDLNIGNVASLKLDPNDNPVLVVIPPPQASPTLTRVPAAGGTWLPPSPTPIPVSNLLSNMADVAFDTINEDIVVFSGSYDGQIQSLQMTRCR